MVYDEYFALAILNSIITSDSELELGFECSDVEVDNPDDLDVFFHLQMMHDQELINLIFDSSGKRLLSNPNGAPIFLDSKLRLTFKGYVYWKNRRNML